MECFQLLENVLGRGTDTVDNVKVGDLFLVKDPYHGDNQRMALAQQYKRNRLTTFIY